MSISGYEAASSAGAADQPILAATWNAHVVDSGAVHDELERLWSEVSGAQAAPVKMGAQQDTIIAGEAHPAMNVLLRANTLNLIAVAHSPDVASRIEQTIVNLTDFHPSRAIILVADPARGRDPSGLDVRVSLVEQPAQRDRPAVRFECVRIVAGTAQADRLASSVEPLLVTGLPGFLWWPGPIVTGGRLFKDLLGIADRVVVDTADIERPAAGIHHLALLAARRRTVSLSDFAWDRLAPWRQLIAQFFDQPALQHCLDCLEEITIEYDGTADRGSGLSAALLVSGWLASRLKWEPFGAMTWDGEAWSSRLQPTIAPAKAIRLVLRPLGEKSQDACLGRITLDARGDNEGTFSVERTASGLTTASETPTMPRVSRMVYTKERSDTDLLGDEIRVFNHDRNYEEALTIAARLLPEGATSR